MPRNLDVKEFHRWESLSNPSFGQVYIDASREDLTRVAGDQSGSGAAREALPQDLETFLMEDNKVTLVAFKFTPFAPYVGSTVPV
jgi:hypothetical protein